MVLIIEECYVDRWVCEIKKRVKEELIADDEAQKTRVSSLD